MKKNLLIVLLLIIGAQVRCMVDTSAIMVDSMKQAGVKIGIQDGIINSLGKMVVDAGRAKQELEKQVFDGRDKYVDRSLVKKYVAAVDNACARQLELRVNEAKLSALKQAKVLFEAVESLERKLVDLGGEAATERKKLYAQIREYDLAKTSSAQEFQRQLREAKMPWYKQFYYKYLAPKSKREQVEELPVFKGMK
jgi:hypothetical protein